MQRVAAGDQGVELGPEYHGTLRWSGARTGGVALRDGGWRRPGAAAAAGARAGWQTVVHGAVRSTGCRLRVVVWAEGARWSRAAGAFQAGWGGAMLAAA